MSVKAKPPVDILRTLQQGELVEQALRDAARKAILEHKKEGIPLAMWRNGKVVWVSAEELEAQLGESSSG